jgi:hypothetical protein
MPIFVTEGNLSSAASETYQDIFAGLWLADYVGSFLNAGGKGLYFFHYLPLKMEPGSFITGIVMSRFLCVADCVAEREGFEPSIQVLARITV